MRVAFSVAPGSSLVTNSSVLTRSAEATPLHVRYIGETLGLSLITGALNSSPKVDATILGGEDPSFLVFLRSAKADPLGERNAGQPFRLSLNAGGIPMFAACTFGAISD